MLITDNTLQVLRVTSTILQGLIQISLSHQMEDDKFINSVEFQVNYQRRETSSQRVLLFQDACSLLFRINPLHAG